MLLQKMRFVSDPMPPFYFLYFFSIDENVYDYTHDCYKQEAYLKSYDLIVHSIPSMY